MSRPYLIGLTGNIACGKSTVLRALQCRGAAVLDADAVAHQVMRRGNPACRAIVDAFGRGVVAPDGEIDRRALGEVVFRDPAALSRLEAIVHPPVLARTEAWLAEVEAEVAVIDAIKLIESGMADRCDEVWVVTCSREEQLRRLTEIRGHTPEEARTRIEAQPPPVEKVARADVVIDNSGTLAALEERVQQAWEGMQRRRVGF